MIYETKHEFMEGLRTALAQNDVKDAREIMIDFEQHFDDGIAAGESEADICRKLGDVEEVVKQYISDDDGGASANTANTANAAGNANTSGGINTEKTVFDTEQPQTAEKTVYDSGQNGGAQTGGNYNYNNNSTNTSTVYTNVSGNNPDTGAIIIALCLDVFIYSWALPTLVGLIFGLAGAAIGITVSGIATFFSGVFGFFFDVSAMVSTGLAPLSLLFLGITLTSLGGMLVVGTVSAVRGFINLCIAIINQHSRAFTGRRILNSIGKKKEAAAQ